MSSQSSKRVPAYLLILLGVVILFAFFKVGEFFYHDYLLDLGRSIEPAPLFMAFASIWMVLGLCAALCITAGITRFFAVQNPAANAGWLDKGNDRVWIAIGATLALVIPVLIRILVLEGSPLTDDETCYRFSAETLANFRLTADSPPHKLFFDHVFMINDGRMFSQYFLGWPALMVPGIWLGIEGYMNAVYCALTVPPLYWTARRLAGPVAARLAVLIYVTSPMLMIGAATMMAHTSCLFALTWALWFVLRCGDDDSKWWHHTLFAVFFCIAFFNRPLTAAGIGLPLIVVWLRHSWNAEQRGRNILAFAAPAAVFGVLFLLVNHVQNGSPLKVSYAAAFDYARANQWRFTHWTEETRMSVGFLDSTLYSKGLAQNALAFFRLNISTFGWPASLLFVPLAWRATKTAPLWWMFVSFIVCHLTLATIGIDSFGPVHYFELALPMILLSTTGILRLSKFLGTMPQGVAAWKRAPIIATGVMIILSLLAYTPNRVSTVAAIATRVNLVLQAPEKAGLENAVVFVPLGLNICYRTLPFGFVYQRPNNDIHLKNSVLWVNHLNAEKDRLLMESFPDRKGYILWWQGECEPIFVPVEQADDERIDPGVPTEYDLSDA